MSELTTQEAAAVLGSLVDVLRGTGEHTGHVRSQVGRCVHCSCGSRVQGTLPPGAVTEAGDPVFEVVLADGFVSVRTNSREFADKAAAKHDGAFVRQCGETT